MPKKLNLQKKKGKKEKKVLTQSPKGMHDILPGEQPWWEKIRKVGKNIADFYNFLRIDTPILESAEVFERSGEATDLVEKQMYFVKTKGGDRLVLRPEGTAPIMRAYLQHGLAKISQPLKLYYFGQMFRYEQPQAGRYREFNQIGFEIIGGKEDPIYDAQVILTIYRLIEELKIKNAIVQINSIGCRNCRAVYRRRLVDYYKNKLDRLCRDCRRRYATNPMRLLDCKNEKCLAVRAGAPIILDNLCSYCKTHFKNVLEYLDALSLPYVLNHYLVRGLDYYNRTVFEIFVEDSNLEASRVGGGLAIASGGRYDYLVEMLGGRQAPGVGGSLGVERLIEAMKLRGLSAPDKSGAKIFLVYIGSEAKKKSLSIIEEFRKADVGIIESFGKESLKVQLAMADKKGAEMALIFGQKEVFEDNIIIRDMKSGMQETMPLARAVEEAKRRLK